MLQPLSGFFYSPFSAKMSNRTYSLQFPEHEIPYWASRYSNSEDEKVENTIGPAVRVRGNYTKSEFLALCHWKSPRTQPLCAKNSEEYVIDITHTSIASNNEQLRIEILTLLHGVNWPTASAILHFGFDGLYPILDFRALSSLGINDVTSCFNYEAWHSYTKYCRKLANKNGVTLRTLDRALWQYSKNPTDTQEMNEFFAKNNYH